VLARRLLNTSLMRPSDHQRRILLVDDQLAILVAMGEHFSWLGFQVDMATSIEEAQALLRARCYAAVVADSRLAVSDAHPGLQFIRMARALSGKTRIILLSAAAPLDNDARSRGADMVLRKWRPLPEVAECLISLLEGSV